MKRIIVLLAMLAFAVTATAADKKVVAKPVQKNISSAKKAKSVKKVKTPKVKKTVKVEEAKKN